MQKQCNGDVFGPEKKVDLVIFDIPPCRQKLEGVAMEIQDAAYPLVHCIIIYNKNSCSCQY